MFDIAHNTDSDSKDRGNALHRIATCQHPADGPHVCLANARKRVVGSASNRTVSNSVLGVFYRSSPHQVCDPVVEPVSVEMPALTPSRFVVAERFKNDAVYGSTVRLSVCSKNNKQIPRPTHPRRERFPRIRHDPLSGNPSSAAAVRPARLDFNFVGVVCHAITRVSNHVSILDMLLAHSALARSGDAPRRYKRAGHFHYSTNGGATSQV